MKKLEIVSLITQNAVAVVKTEPAEVQNGKTIVHTLEDGRTLTKYNVNLMEKQGESVTARNVPFIVFDEGKDSEEAFLSQQAVVARSDEMSRATKEYLNAQNFVSFTIQNVDEEARTAVAIAIADKNDGTAEEQKLFIFNSGEKLAHRVLV